MSALIIEQFYLDCLSQASYLVGDTNSGRAAVVDPRRDIDEYLTRAGELGLRIDFVLETHFHADFLSGHLELAAATGAEIVYGDRARPEFPALLLADGEVIDLGSVSIEVRHTPGHTPESVCYVVSESGAASPEAVFTGDTMFIGDAGRPDLLVSVGVTAQDLAGSLYDSLHGKLLSLPDSTRVLPAHGAGSACGKNLSTETMSSIGEQRANNYALNIENRELFIATISQGQPPAPAYFAYNALGNQRQREVFDETVSLSQLTFAQLAAHQAGGGVVLDVRDPQVFASGHLVGSLNVGFDGRLAEYVGSVVPSGVEIAVVCDDDYADSVRTRLARIGFDNLVGWFPASDLAEHPEAVSRGSRLTPSAFRDRHAEMDGLQVIDVRAESEYQLGHVQGAVSVPVAQLVTRAGEFDPNVPTVVYCAGGYRSSIAASVLRHRGFRDVSDIIGGFGAVLSAGT